MLLWRLARHIRKLRRVRVVTVVGNRLLHVEGPPLRIPAGRYSYTCRCISMLVCYLDSVELKNCIAGREMILECFGLAIYLPLSSTSISVTLLFTLLQTSKHHMGVPTTTQAAYSACDWESVAAFAFYRGSNR